MCLKLVEEVEETECENSAGANQSHQKPTGMEKLITMGNRFYPGVVTETVYDLHCVNTRDIKQCEYCGFGWERAGVFNVMAELVCHT